MYSNFTKPLLDLILFGKNLSETLGHTGPLICIFWYAIAAFILKIISPSFGRLIAQEQHLEGKYRACHSDIVNFSEEISFYQGENWEKNKLLENFKNLLNLSIDISFKKLYMGTFDSLLVKYGAVMCGYAVLSWPVFGPNRIKYLQSVNNDASIITRDYIRNSSLLINLAKAVGRLVITYKEIQSLAGYAAIVSSLKQVMDDLENNLYIRKVIIKQQEELLDQEEKLQPLNLIDKGQIIEADMIKFDNVPIFTPNLEKIINNLDFEIKYGQNCIIKGANACGKTSLFRVLSQLWPLLGGKLYKPDQQDIYFVPQRSYFPTGTLRDQIIYPHSKLDMLRKGVKDSQLRTILESVDLKNIEAREGGFDSQTDWYYVLSGGEKQKMSIARLLYHCPKFAILDDSTCAVAVDQETNLYKAIKAKNITIITVTFKDILFQFHDYVLKVEDDVIIFYTYVKNFIKKNWSFNKIKHNS